MLPHVLDDLIAAGTAIIGDGGIASQLAATPGVVLDPHIGPAALIDQRDGRDALRQAYTAYVDVGWAHGLPVLLGTPTSRAGRRELRQAGRGGVEAVRRVNAEAVALLAEIRAGGDHEPVFIAGVVGPHGDRHYPADGLPQFDGAAYHAPQVQALVESGVDLIVASAFPTIEEAHGAALAMSMTTVPYAIGFALDERGRLLDGTTLADAIERIDDRVVPEPTHYAICCVHPGVARRALRELETVAPRRLSRLREVKADACARPVTSARGETVAVTDSPEEFATAMHALAVEYNVAVLGGCCGTDSDHLAALARRLEASTA